ncbi:MAG: OmpL47-type beta-barrel domain-containing protein [Thermoplasmata archaeon]
MTSTSSIVLSANDFNGAGVAQIAYRIDNGSWRTYDQPINLADPGAHTIQYRATDGLGNKQAAEACSVFVDDSAPLVFVSPAPTGPGSIELEAGEHIILNSTDIGVGWEVIHFSLDNGITWRVYTDPIEAEEERVIMYYAVDALWNKGEVQALNVTLIGGGTASGTPQGDDVLFAGALLGIGAIVLILVLVLMLRAEWLGKERKGRFDE